MEKALGTLIKLLIRYLPNSVVKDGIDALLDVVEDKVNNTETKIDDVVLPICNMIRLALDISDND